MAGDRLPEGVRAVQHARVEATPRHLARVASGRHRPALVLAWLLVPFALALLVSLVQPMLVPRYLIVCLPPLLLLAVAGIERAPSWLAGAALAACLALSDSALASWYQRPPLEDWRSAAAHVLGRARPADRIVFHAPYIRQPFDYYARRSGKPAPAELAVEEVAKTPAPRLWLVLAHNRWNESHRRITREVLARRDTRYRLRASRSFEGPISVHLYERAGA